MAKRKKEKTPSVPKVSSDEKEQIRIRKQMGHDFALAEDQFGRQRLAKGTTESTRKYVQNRDGRINIRNADPLKDIKLSADQIEAAERYRDASEIVGSHGLSSTSLGERVDSSGSGGGFPERVIDAASTVRTAKENLLPQHLEVINSVCIERMSMRSLAAQIGKTRDVVKDRLETGLDHLARIYRIRPTRRKG